MLNDLDKYQTKTLLNSLRKEDFVIFLNIVFLYISLIKIN